MQPELVRRLVDLAPPRMTLGARAAAPIVTGERSLVTTDGCCVEIYVHLGDGARTRVPGGERPAFTQCGARDTLGRSTRVGGCVPRMQMTPSRSWEVVRGSTVVHPTHSG